MKNTDEYAVSMKKAQGKEFKILALSDLQLNDALACFGMKGTAYSTAEKVIKEQNPDLIVVMGDTVWAAFTKASVKQFVKFMDSFIAESERNFIMNATTMLLCLSSLILS